MKKRIRERVGKGKRGRTASDDPGGKSLSEKSKTVRGQCVGEKSTGAVIHSNANIFEASRKNKTQYFVDVVKDKRRTKNNTLEVLIG